MTDTNDDNLIPTEDQAPMDQQSAPSTPTEPQEVPSDAAEAGTDTNEPQADSPESLDDALNQGDNRDDIDPTDMTTPQGIA